MEKKEEINKEEDDRVAIVKKANEDLLVLAESFGRVILRTGTQADSSLKDWLKEFYAIASCVVAVQNKTLPANPEFLDLVIAFQTRNEIIHDILEGLFEGMKET